METVKKNRIQRLISSIDAILKGESQMDFKVFDKLNSHLRYFKGFNNCYSLL